MLNLRELLIGMPVRLRYVNRFSTCRVLKSESVAEHCFFVGFYALMIAEWCRFEASSLSLNLGEILTRALVHDLDEAATGDVPRFFKYSDPELKVHLDVVAERGVDSITSKLWESDGVRRGILFNWKQAKNDTPEGRIIEFADFLSVLSYIYEEVRSSNSIMKEHIYGMVGYYKNFEGHEFNFIRPLIEDARKILFDEILLNGA